jgi:RNA polymerase sigma-70 factor, ECF subfamily
MPLKDLDFDVADCIARARAGDEDAARALVRYLHPEVAAIVRRRLPRAAAEEDLVQEIFLKIFQKLHRYKGEAPLNHWVSRIAVNRCLNAIRSQKLRPEWRMADFSEEQEAAFEPKSTAIEEWHPAHAIAIRELVETILKTLSPEDSLIIRMLEIEDLSVAEIRKATGWSATFIRVRACRARQKLNKRFAHCFATRTKGRRGTALRRNKRPQPHRAIGTLYVDIDDRPINGTLP